MSVDKKFKKCKEFIFRGKVSKSWSNRLSYFYKLVVKSTRLEFLKKVEAVRKSVVSELQVYMGVKRLEISKFVWRFKNTEMGKNV